MARIESLAPVGSEEMLRAAVFSGADAVNLGFSGFNARTGAGNFDADSLQEAVRFCHARGVAVHVALATPVCGAEQRALAESLGLRGAALARLAALAPAFATVVNTIPAPVLTEPVLAALRPGSLIVDLASKPGGTDFAAAQRLGCKAIHALSLPAACAPDTAGEAVARTVLTILREREEHT